MEKGGVRNDSGNSGLSLNILARCSGKTWSVPEDPEYPDSHVEVYWTVVWRVMQNAILACCLLLLSFASVGQPSETYSNLVLGGFSPDGAQLALSYCTNKVACKTGLLDLNRKTFVSIVPADPDRFYIPGGFSPSGRHLAVTVRRSSDNGLNTQVALVELRTGKLVELTHSPGHRAAPSFSHDGKKIIFAQANRERKSGMTRFSDWDVYELSIGEGVERQLTYFEFFSVTPPAYLQDDEHFVFSGDGPHAYISASGAKGYEAYKAQFRDNNIFKFAVGGQRSLRPMFSIGRYSSFPVVPFDGSAIAYVAMSHELDGVKHGFTYDVFLLDGKGHKRLTKLNGLITDIAMSSNGRQIAVVVQPRDRLQSRELKLVDVQTGRIESLNPITDSVK